MVNLYERFNEQQRYILYKTYNRCKTVYNLSAYYTPDCGLLIYMHRSKNRCTCYVFYRNYNMLSKQWSIGKKRCRLRDLFAVSSTLLYGVRKYTWMQCDKENRYYGLPSGAELQLDNGLFRETEWCKYGMLHRSGDLPAIIRDGNQYWFINNEHHRDNGKPATIMADGYKQYYVHGKEIK